MLTAVERVDTETLRVRVLRVFDGDGFLGRFWHPGQGREIEAGVRFGFIDAPEIGQPGGLEAKQFLEQIIADKWLELSILTIFATGKVIDRHNRLLCVPYLPEGHGQVTGASPLDFLKALISPFGSGSMMRNVELEMVLNGWAWVVEKYGPDEKYLDALADARQSKRGIWAQTDNVAPWHFKQQHRKVGKRTDAGNQANLFANTELDMNCPVCRSHLVRRDGKFGSFVGCSSFPKCRYTRAT